MSDIGIDRWKMFKEKIQKDGTIENNFRKIYANTFTLPQFCTIDPEALFTSAYDDLTTVIKSNWQFFAIHNTHSPGHALSRYSFYPKKYFNDIYLLLL